MAVGVGESAGTGWVCVGVGVLVGAGAVLVEVGAPTWVCVPVSVGPTAVSVVVGVGVTKPGQGLSWYDIDRPAVNELLGFSLSVMPSQRFTAGQNSSG